jgi:hypothetical protein
MRWNSPLLAIVGLVLFCNPVGWCAITGEGDTLLTEAEVARMPKEAQASYQKALRSYDRIDRDMGVIYLEEAAKAAAEFIPLQFILVQRARDRGRFHSGHQALKYFDIAEQAVQRILAQPELTLEQKRNAEDQLRFIQNARETQAAKDKKKAELGFRAIVFPLALERARNKGMDVDNILGKKAEVGKTRAEETGAVPAFKPVPGFPAAPPPAAFPMQQPPTMFAPAPAPFAPTTPPAQGVPLF